MQAPSSISFVSAYLTSREVFGETMSASFLKERIRSFGWKPSVTNLAQLAAFIQNPATTAEQVRTRTVDPIHEISGSASAGPMLARAKDFVRRNRPYIQIAHEEVLTYLQHLILVEGGDIGEGPSDAELAFWMLGANCHLGEWSKPDERELTRAEQVIALLMRRHCFDKSGDWAAIAVRNYELFRACPAEQSLGGGDSWAKLQEEAFGSSFDLYYSLILAPLAARVIRPAPDADDRPVVSVDYWRSSGADLNWVKKCLDGLAVSRDEARTQILERKNSVNSDGLLHAPTLLRRKPLLTDGEGWLITSPAAIIALFHAGPWGAYLEKLKASHGGSEGFKRWSSAFGAAFEQYCADWAKAAAASAAFRRGWKMMVPDKSGTAEEIEDVILIEEDHAVVFSVKSSLVPEDTLRIATSQSAAIDWIDRFLFSGTKSFKGAVRKLSANIDEIRRGDFAIRGVSETLKIHPVLVTYDALGEDVDLYARIRKQCSEHTLLCQKDVAPLTLASISDYERMMLYVHSGRSLVGMLKKRKRNRPWFGRRLEQQMSCLNPPVSSLVIFERFKQVFGKVLTAMGRDAALINDAPYSPRRDK
jgi:hypothetical protein